MLFISIIFIILICVVLLSVNKYSIKNNYKLECIIIELLFLSIKMSNDQLNVLFKEICVRILFYSTSLTKYVHVLYIYDQFIIFRKEYEDTRWI